MIYKNNNESFLKQMVKQLLALVDHLSELLQQKEEQLQSKYRLVDWIINKKTQKGVCRIQVIGTGCVADYNPQEIIVNDQFISGFHPQDARTITNLANLEAYRPTSKLSSIDYIEDDRIVTIQDRDGGKQELSIEMIKKNKELLATLSSEDAFNLGRLIGDDDSSL